jgi:hypothetical protein
MDVTCPLRMWEADRLASSKWSPFAPDGCAGNRQPAYISPCAPQDVQRQTIITVQPSGNAALTRGTAFEWYFDCKCPDAIMP